jgi:hypothetical protein
MSDRQAWFEYTVTPGRFTAVPVNWKGWLSLVALVTAPTGLLLAAGPWLRASDLARVLAVPVLLAFIFTTLFALIKAKGRPAAR